MFRFFPLIFIFFSFCLFLFVVSFLTYDLSIYEKKILEQDSSDLVFQDKIRTPDLSFKEVQKIEEKEIISQQNKNNEKISKFPNSNSIFKVQFGAFSSLKKAEIAKKALILKLNENNLNFPIDINFLEKKIIYQVIHQAQDLKDAQRICEISKSLKLDCYVKKL